MRQIRICDRTIRAAAGSGQLSFREKLELARLLDRLGVAVIEVPAPENLRADTLLIKSMAAALEEATLAVPVNALEEDSPARIWEGLKEAKHPRLQVEVPVSTVQMEYFFHKKPAAVLELIGRQVAACRALCREVEFVAEDAGRSEPEFLLQCLEAALLAGATTLSVCDAAGTSFPGEFGDFAEHLRASLPESVRLGVRCVDSLYMADACGIAALLAGADEIKTTVCGDGCSSLERVARILAQKGPEHDLACGIHITELERIASQIQRICEGSRSCYSPFDSGVKDSAEQLSLTVHDSREAVARVALRLGYSLSQEDLEKVYEAFLRIASKKDEVGEKELDAIIASAAMQVPPTYRLESYVINTGNTIMASCHMRLTREGKLLDSICLGDGPIDAAFLALEQIIGCHFELDDFQIQAITEGREAMGETVVRLRSEGKVYSGLGISTDIVGSSILAYINAVNKIVYEEALE